MSQILVPIADIDQGTWETKLDGDDHSHPEMWDLVQQVSVAPDDDTFVWAGKQDAPNDDGTRTATFSVLLAPGVNPFDTSLVVPAGLVHLRWRTQKTTGSTVSTKAWLYQGERLIAVSAPQTTLTAWTTHVLALSDAEVTSITDWSNLEVHIERSTSLTDNDVHVNAIEFEGPSPPDAPGGPGDLSPSVIVQLLQVQTPVTFPRREDVALPQYADLLLALWPHGRAWNQQEQSVTGKLRSALGLELARVDLRVADLLQEADPSKAHELLAEWERILGLPDPCLGPGSDEAERRAALIAKLAGGIGFSKGALISFALSLGYTITIAEYQPCVAGLATAGSFCYGQAWRYAFSVTYWGAGDRSILECVIRARLLAHVAVVFLYGEATPAVTTLSLAVQNPAKLT